MSLKEHFYKLRDRFRNWWLKRSKGIEILSRTLGNGKVQYRAIVKGRLITSSDKEKFFKMIKSRS